VTAKRKLLNLAIVLMFAIVQGVPEKMQGHFSMSRRLCLHDCYKAVLCYWRFVPLTLLTSDRIFTQCTLLGPRWSTFPYSIPLYSPSRQSRIGLLVTVLVAVLPKCTHALANHSGRKEYTPSPVVLPLTIDSLIMRFGNSHWKPWPKSVIQFDAYHGHGSTLSLNGWAEGHMRKCLVTQRMAEVFYQVFFTNTYIRAWKTLPKGFTFGGWPFPRVLKKTFKCFSQ
jgi:hypothetical protein